MTDKFHPFDVSFVYFTRLERGPIPNPSSMELRSQHMEKYLLAGIMDRDPIQMLYNYLSQVHALTLNVRYRFVTHKVEYTSRF